MNAAFYLKITNNIVEDAEFVFGGMSTTTIIAQKTKSLIISSKWSEEMIDDVYLELLKDLPLASNAPGGMVTYRKVLVLRYNIVHVYIFMKYIRYIFVAYDMVIFCYFLVYF